MNELIELEQKVAPVVAWAQGLHIENDYELELVDERKKDIRQLERQIDETFDPSIDAAKKNLAEARALKAKFTDPLKTAYGLAADAQKDYFSRKEKEAQKAAEKAAEEARIQTEKDLEAARKKIDKLGLQAGSIESELKELGLLLNDPNSTETEMQVAQAKIDTLQSKLDSKRGAIEETAQRAEIAAMAPVPAAVPTAVSKPPGMSARKEKILTVINKGAVLRAIVDGLIGEDLVDIDMGKLKRMVNAGAIVPGVTWIEQYVVATRTAGRR